MKHLLLTTIAAVLSGNVLLAEPFDQKLYDTKARTYSPEESMAMMELQEGYRVELVAAEPMVQEPAAIAFDGDGKLYVATRSVVLCSLRIPMTTAAWTNARCSWMG